MKGRKSNAEFIRNRVIGTLKAYPNGLTLRELGRKSGIPKSTIAYHTTRTLLPYIEEITIAPAGKTLIRLIRLKIDYGIQKA